MRLHSSAGDLVPGRCRATNLCDYCAKLSAVEWAEMLALDALDGEAPGVWMVLTTSRAECDPAAFHEARRAVVRAVQLRWPTARYVCITEFTTGYGAASGGQRRPHFNVLWKGVPAGDEPELERIAVRVWCERSDTHAKPAGQFVGTVTESGGLMRYLALHFLKESQRPPEGWSGQRVTFSTSRGKAGGYFTRPVWKVRAEAQRALRLKRELHRAHANGMTGEGALMVAEAELLAAERKVWACVRVHVSTETGELRRLEATDRLMRNGPIWAKRRAATLARRVEAGQSVALVRAEAALHAYAAGRGIGPPDPPQLSLAADLPASP